MAVAFEHREFAGDACGIELVYNLFGGDGQDYAVVARGEHEHRAFDACEHVAGIHVVALAGEYGEAVHLGFGYVAVHHEQRAAVAFCEFRRETVADEIVDQSFAVMCAGEASPVPDDFELLRFRFGRRASENEFLDHFWVSRRDMLGHHASLRHAVQRNILQAERLYGEHLIAGHFCEGISRFHVLAPVKKIERVVFREHLVLHLQRRG